MTTTTETADLAALAALNYQDTATALGQKDIESAGAAAQAITAAADLQAYINAYERDETIKYGLRSIKACRGHQFCTGTHFAQLRRAQAAAGGGCLKAAKKASALELKAAKKAKGTATQLRLALKAAS